VGQLGDSAYVTMDLREGDKDIFIGHPIVCDDKEVFINVVQTGEKKFGIYLHNPTPKEKRIRVRSADQWNWGKLPTRQISLDPGEVKAIEWFVE